ncbi:MAG TPA: hypothetical protein VHA54_04070 [Solirubrobacterales bacterium]|nr:hypothetical protein [Solirubrobacterales bacterium]
MRRGLALLLAVAACACAVALATRPGPADAREMVVCLRRPVVAQATRCGERVIVEFHASATPGLLPARTPMPVAVHLETVIGTEGGAVPTAARELTIDFDKAGSLDTNGLATCSASRIEELGTAGARRACRRAIVGSGRAEVAIGTAGTEALDLTLFNGGRHAGAPTVLVHAASADALAPAHLVIPVKLERQSSGPYGWEATVPVPAIPGAERATLLRFELDVKRLFSHHGSRHSYLTAQCPRGSLQMALGVQFSDGTRLLGTVVRPCRPSQR